jgi:hypothetical protein
MLAFTTLDNLGIDRARTLDGQRVLVSLRVGKPPYTWNGVTVVGALNPYGFPAGINAKAKRFPNCLYLSRYFLTSKLVALPQ